MRIGRRVLGLALAAVLVVGGTIWAVAAIRWHVVFGTVVDESSAAQPVVVHVGERFSLAVPDKGPSVGDQWSATLSTNGVLDEEDSRQIADSLLERTFGAQLGGGAGTRYFRYTAKHPGTITVRMANCFQGMCRLDPAHPFSDEVSWTITVE